MRLTLSFMYTLMNVSLIKNIYLFESLKNAISFSCTTLLSYNDKINSFSISKIGVRYYAECNYYQYPVKVKIIQIN